MKAERRRGGKGFGLLKAQQDAVEAHAVAMARQHLATSGWDVKNVGERETWDIEAAKDGERIWVEVKGTTSTGQSVIFAGANVRKYRAKEPHTRLIVVHDIELDQSLDPPTTSGGRATEIAPWSITDDALEVVSYKFTTGL